MKLLPADGSPKYLLIDTPETLRNAERHKPGTAVALVVTLSADGTPVLHRGFAVLADGPVGFSYVQRGKLFEIRTSPGAKDEPIRAAFYTLGAVAISEERDEVLTLPDATGSLPKASSEKPKASTKQKAS